MSQDTVPDFDCNNTFPELTWGSVNACGQLPISIICMLASATGWGALLLVSGLRRLKHVRSATKNTVVAKKMQHFQAWGYSFFHSMVYLSTLFSIVSLIDEGQYISASVIAGASAFGLLFSSQIDVIGSTSRTPGVNGVSPVIVGDYLLTTHLAKVVWKTSGHMEYEDGDSKEISAVGKLCLAQDLDNIITPKVYDIKDVVGIQGAFIGLPALFAYLFTTIRSNGAAAFDVTVEDFLNNPEGALLPVFDFNTLTTVAAVMAFLSAVLPPLLGDWETYSKSVVKSAGSVIVRSVELLARLGFYMYFIDFSEFAGLALLGTECVVMLMTNITANDSSAGGRTGSTHHYLLSTWESTFFTNYRRLSVDKELVMHNTLMPTTIEFIRFISRTLATVIGYGMIIADMPGSYVSTVRDVHAMPAVFFMGVASNALVIVFNVINFLVVNRSSMDRKDLARLRSYWLSFCCSETTVHLNRDNQYAQGGITYV